MGFLDHSTNNIIVDAVLTDLGRQALANGTFDVTQFSLADDEVDYSIIQKYGRAVGKEKVIKNTPILEASTVATLAMKHRLMTSADPTIIYLPTVTLGGDGASGTITFTQASSSDTLKTVTLTQTINSVTTPAAKLPIDTEFYVEVPNRFLNLQDTNRDRITISSSRIEQSTQTALYVVDVESTTEVGLPSVSLTFGLQGLDTNTFNVFGTNAAKTRIDCVISVIGVSTGLRTTINAIINKAAS